MKAHTKERVPETGSHRIGRVSATGEQRTAFWSQDNTILDPVVKANRNGFCGQGTASSLTQTRALSESSESLAREAVGAS